MLLASVGYAKDDIGTSPEANARSYGQNYKDMVLATCIANAYRDDKSAAIDAGSSVSALRDWTEYDLEKAPDSIKALVNRYLARDYHNPLAESEVQGVRFDLLKCLDLYHSKELDAQVKRLVINPKRTDRQEK
ncbi:type VI secretion system amidase immunity protein Tai4 [Pseudomonas gingeri]|uniref:type VI secretion system amidase immunity protein Tai4 n=1 Tax=Pseudomonas gingeri TaxID=117681 RepID=UPI0015A1998A|nr:type VI secretion system amidase immunity protein Tai4 [Pseudomonas gingeri]NWD77154.1 type VI secretion system amidase immunity protein Tai4 [Pseudomonas gingeri]